MCFKSAGQATYGPIDYNGSRGTDCEPRILNALHSMRHNSSVTRRNAIFCRGIASGPHGS